MFKKLVISTAAALLASVATAQALSATAGGVKGQGDTTRLQVALNALKAATNTQGQLIKELQSEIAANDNELAALTVRLLAVENSTTQTTNAASVVNAATTTNITEGVQTQIVVKYCRAETGTACKAECPDGYKYLSHRSTNGQGGYSRRFPNNMVQFRGGLRPSGQVTCTK